MGSVARWTNSFKVRPCGASACVGPAGMGWEGVGLTKVGAVWLDTGTHLRGVERVEGVQRECAV